MSANLSKKASPLVLNFNQKLSSERLIDAFLVLYSNTLVTKTGGHSPIIQFPNAPNLQSDAFDKRETAVDTAPIHPRGLLQQKAPQRMTCPLGHASR